MATPEPQLRHVETSVHGRFLVRPAAAPGPACWLVGFHGYAQSARIFWDSLTLVPASPQWLVASVQALHPFYTKGEQVVANWMTREDREHAIRDNIAYVDRVLDALAAEHGEPRALVFAGFSQGVAMAYRAARRGRRRPAALVAAGGDIAPDVLDEGQPWPQVLLATGNADAWYTPARLEREAAQLRERGAAVRTQVFEGGHEWGGAVAGAVGELLGELERTAPPAV